MTADAGPAAFHGAGFRPRTGTLAQDNAAGHGWSGRSNTSEYGPLREVLLAPPDPALAAPDDPDAVQHLRRVDYRALHREVRAIADCFERLGVRVRFVRTRARSHAGWFHAGPWHNLFFVRDLFFMTPQGAVVARMGSDVRAGEERYIAHTLTGLDVPVLRTVADDGTFEGADALWAGPDLVLVGTGNRTNASGLRQLAECLAPSGVRVVGVPLPPRIQHLLGILQLVDHDLAVVRGELLGPGIRGLLAGRGIRLVELAETPEVVRDQAMNFVTVAPRRIVMAHDAPGTRALLERAGIAVVGQVRIDELRKAAGGLACATGILARAPEREADPPAPHRGDDT